MTERRGRQPGPEAPRPEPGGGQRDSQVIRGAELEHLKASRPEMANSPFALKWTDEQGRSHLGYNYGQTTVGRDGVSRVDFYYDAPPTFESTYEGWRVGTAPVVGPDGEVHPAALYTLHLNLRSRRGREVRDKFLREADEAGYGVTSVTDVFPAPPRMATGEGSPVMSLSFLLQERSPEEDDTPNQT
jgi:hypothetical protein